MNARRFRVHGVVQGVGFRPFVYRLAQRLRLAGWVRNDGAGVQIHVEGGRGDVARFRARLSGSAPPASSITTIDALDTEPLGLREFQILASDIPERATTSISPDLCVCDECVRELRDRHDRRCGYEYINCTHCGPRYSIIRSLPYDRPRTTMASWPLCDACGREYGDPDDRRFHAQPVACSACGPRYWLRTTADDTERIGSAAIRDAARLLRSGRILAIKGVGGYHLACDARHVGAVRELRTRKFRKQKPFAVMASTPAVAGRLVELDDVQRALLESSARPIVVAGARRTLPGVAPDTRELGVMLPYAPLHHLLFDAGAPDPLVLTSANRSSEPIAFEDGDARERLRGIADGFLGGQRPIQRRVDDSVVTSRGGHPFMLRRSRGYAPARVARLRAEYPILAVGADLKNTIALGIDGEVLLSQHIGDLGDLATDTAFRTTIEDLLAMYAVRAQDLVVAHDLHPEYVSTRTALALPAARHVAVQHHHAHMAGVLLELGMADVPAVGVILDGTGYGLDGGIWGGEVLVGGLGSGFERVGSLRPVAMPGGDAAARFPPQAAAAFLPDVDIAMMEGGPLDFPPRFRQARALIASGLRCIPSTSVGRLFDAAAAVCGFTRAIEFEGQAAMWLEQQAAPGRVEFPATLDGRRLLRQVLAARVAGRSVSSIAYAFHDSLARAFGFAAVGAARRAGVSHIVLSGGCGRTLCCMSVLSRR